MVVVPALSPTNVALADATFAGITMDDGLQCANADAVRFTVSGEAAGLLSRIGIEALDPRPTDTVSRPNEMIAGTAPPTVTVRIFDVMAPLVAVMSDVPMETPVTTPVTGSTVATAGVAEE